jgi:hypothetical protein
MRLFTLFPPARDSITKSYNYHVGAWTMKETGKPKKNELERFREAREQNQKHLGVIEGLLEKVDDKRMKSYRYCT